jgi:hypothetical protein
VGSFHSDLVSCRSLRGSSSRSANRKAHVIIQGYGCPMIRTCMLGGRNREGIHHGRGERDQRSLRRCPGGQRWGRADKQVYFGATPNPFQSTVEVNYTTQAWMSNKALSPAVCRFNRRRRVRVPGSHASMDSGHQNCSLLFDDIESPLPVHLRRT